MHVTNSHDLQDLTKIGSGALTLGVPTSPGVTKGNAADTLTAQYNNISSVKELVANNKSIYALPFYLVWISDHRCFNNCFSKGSFCDPASFIASRYHEDRQNQQPYYFDPMIEHVYLRGALTKNFSCFQEYGCG